MKLVARHHLMIMAGIVLMLFFPVKGYTTVTCTETPPAGETALFGLVANPDALILLDLSGSMANSPPDQSSQQIWGDSTCDGPFYNSSGSGHTVNCSKLAMAQRAIFSVLDDNADGTINSADQTSAGVRFGYMRFYNCSSDESTLNYSTGCNKLIYPINTAYSTIFCGNSTSCTSSSTCSGSTICVNGESASGGTPEASALAEAKLYMDASKAADSSGACRKKFVIILTDGEDTYACNGNGQGTPNQTDMYRRRRAQVAMAQALGNAGYELFVIGFGSSMPLYEQNTLNWMAYYGGTKNTSTTQSGSTSAFNPSGITLTSCATSRTTTTCTDQYGTNTGAGYCATTNDTATATLTGYAYIATDTASLNSALSSTISAIKQALYSFSSTSVASTRTSAEDYLYEASFIPSSFDPFWQGHLKQYPINSDGTLGSMVWDAGSVLASTTYTSRNQKTYTSGLVAFNTTNVTMSALGVSSTATQAGIIGYFQGNPTYNPENWYLGDIFHSEPVTVGSPSPYFYDYRDTNNAYATFASNNTRTLANGNEVIAVGANDGQLHAFTTNTGTESWSFFPPNLLGVLQEIYHTSNPSSLSHWYYVDGPVSVADVWLGTGDGTSKQVSEWQTMMVFGEGRGGMNLLWSSNSNCLGGLQSCYDSSHHYYCPYYALNVTNTLSPALAGLSGSQWLTISPTAAQAPYLGDAWSKMAIGRVLVNISGNLREKWVGFIGAGYNASSCTSGTVCGTSCDCRGKGFYVIDLSNGTVLWNYTLASNSSMIYPIAAAPIMLDTDNDGFVDTVYVGDTGGNMWRFDLCTASQMPSCSTSQWSGSLLFSSPVVTPIYTAAAAGKDTSGNLWIYWGTGDKMNPTSTTTQDYFYAVIDPNRTSTVSSSSIMTILEGSSTSWNSANYPGGYRIQLATSEKDLSDPSLFQGVLYFSTYTPSSDPCTFGGTAQIYAINYATGTGALSGGAMSQNLGTYGVSGGIPSSPVLSIGPGSSGVPNIYVTLSGVNGTAENTSKVNITPPGMPNKTNMIYWRDMRVQ
jgi:Tfp pilus tip-associated adhesin PilY1